MTVVNIIQDMPTPHNNVAIKKLNDDPSTGVHLWYAYDKHEQYAWDKDLANEICIARIYGARRVSWELLKYILTHRNEKYLIVGWSNPTTRMIILVLWLIRIKYCFWTDCPNDNMKRNYFKQVLREFYYFMLKYSNSTVFCVGKATIEYFKNRRFNDRRLINLPILVEIDKTKDDYLFRKPEIMAKYRVNKGDLFILAGSRLVFEKGYDLLIEGIRLLPEYVKTEIKVLIVGKGQEKENLIKLIDRYRLSSIVFIEDWMNFDDFKAVIACSHLFIHPARFDAYGNSLYAMSLGTPVIGSYQAGAAFDLVTDKENGFLYDSEDIQTLSNLIKYFFDNRQELASFSQRTTKSIEKCTPEIAIKNLKEGLMYE